MAFNMLSLADTYGAGERARQDAQELESRNALAGLQRDLMGQRMQNDQAAEERAASEERRQQGKYDMEQRVAALKLAHAGLSAVAQDPAQAEFWEQDFKRAGLLRPDFDWRTVPPHELQAYAQRELKGMSAALEALAQKQGGPQIGSFNPGAYTPESFARFQQSGNAADLVRYVTPARSSVVTINSVPTLVNPNTGATNPLSTLDREASGKARIEGALAGAKVANTKAAEARADLPRVAANADLSLKLLGELKNAPLQYIYGAASVAPVIPGTQQADAYALWEQLQGQAFLRAFESLKGGGQITEVEGEKATAAITRLSQRKMSPQAARIAINDLEDIVKKGVERARSSASAAGTPAETIPAQPATGARSLNDLLEQYGR